MSYRIIGIDPGQSGGIAVLDVVNGYTIVTEPQKLDGLSERDIADCLAGWWAGHVPGEFPVRAVLEQVHSMPRQGVSSTFKFGQSYGFLRGVLVATSIPFETVTPAKWQRAVGLQAIPGEGQIDHKRRTKALAQQLYPSTPLTHATADALLIAHYGATVSRTFPTGVTV